MKPRNLLAAGLLALLSCIALLAPQCAVAAERDATRSSLDAREKSNREDLLAPLREKGEVRVVVGLQTPQEIAQGVDRTPDQLKEQAVAARQLRVLKRLAGHNAREVRRLRLHHFLALTVDSSALEALLADPEVTSVAEDRPRFPVLQDTPGITRATNAWAAGVRGAGQVVAILDTGVDGAHPLFSGKVFEEACFSQPVGTNTSYCPGGVSERIGPDSAVPCPDAGCWHGTHVAGIATGRSGVLGTTSGIAPEAGIIAIQVFQRGSSLLAYDSDILAALDHVHTLRNKYNIAAVNLSLGGDLYSAHCDDSLPAYKTIIESLRDAGIATVVSAGNDGSANALSAPACVSNAISVGSTTKQNAISSFSNSASFLSLLAPGSSITSSVPGGGFGIASGTSMAAPHVAGAWALLKSANSSAPVLQILTALQGSGLPITDTRNGLVKPLIQIGSAESQPGALGMLGQHAAPVVTLTSPATGATFVAPANITLAASAAATAGASIVRVEFYWGIQKISEDLTAPYTIVWTGVPEGSYTLSARAIDSMGGTGVSAPLTVSVGSSTPAVSITGDQSDDSYGAAADTVWVEDALPAGATAGGTGEGWNWVSTNPAPFSGALAHQSNVLAGIHQHYFDNATNGLTVGVGDKLFAYVYLDPANPPSQVMLQWYDGVWDHRAYWGANLIPWGTDGTASRRFMGALPPAGQWVRLEVPAALVGLEGRTLRGMAFALYNGRATWDRAGKAPSSEFVWVEDALPAGATAGGTGESWNWVSTNPAPFSGSLAHQSALVSGIHQHYFSNATATLSVGVGDKLFAYIYLDPANPPNEVMLQWYAGGSWNQRAYWGANLIPWGTDGTASRRFIGALPPAGQWVRLEVPASLVGLEGSTVTGMAFALYNGRATWDRAGKASGAEQPTFTVSGTVTLSGSGLNNVGMTATNGASCSNTNASGQYSCTVPQGWSGTVTPSLSGHTFTPPSRSYSNVVANQTTQNYAAAVSTYQLSGTVTAGASALNGVNFTASAGASCTASNSSGQYTCTVPQGWSGTVTPTLSGYTFTPPSRSYSNVTANQTAQNYAATVIGPTTFQVSGTVTLNSSGLNNVSMAATNGVSCSNTNASGQYSCTVPQGWSGTVTPTLSGHTFTPSSRSYSNVAANQAAQNYAAAGSSDVVWVEDALPAGATTGGTGESWNWVGANPAPFSGSLAHQSALLSGIHQHYFDNATATLAVGLGDKLFAYVYLDPANPPNEVMLQWYGGGSWNHRAYWGANSIPWGTDGTASRRFMGALPPAGQWVRLEVPASLVGLEGSTVTGMAFALYNGRATWDRAGKATSTLPTFSVSGTVTLGGSPLIGVSFGAGAATSCTASNASGQYSCTVPQGWSGTVTPTLSGYTFTPSSRSYSSVVANQTGQNYAAAASAGGADIVWVEDALPAGATPGGTAESWNWVSANPAPFSGSLAHQSALASGIHQHYFSDADATLPVGSGDKLFAYVYLDPANPPSEVMLQWHANGSWNYRAYWGANLIAWGTDGTASRRFMGALPPAGQWVRLEVPAALVGLEGSTVDGMSYTLYDGRATWDHAGNVCIRCPVVSLTAPANNATYTAPASVAINATATDSGGSVSRVEFYWETSLLAVDTTSPYGFTWTNVPAGSYSLTAKAYDNSGMSSVSSPVTITVNGSGSGSPVPRRPTVTKNGASIVVGWSTVQNATGYTVYASYDAAGANIFRTYSSSSTSITIPVTDFPSLSSLYFSVAATVSGQVGNKSKWAYLLNVQNIPLGISGLLAITIGDVNNDGCVEVLGTINDCAGNLTATPYTNIGLSEAALRDYSHGRMADFNGDGILDVIVNGYFPLGDPASTVLLYYGNGDGTFTKATPAQFPSTYGGFGETIVVADFDNDGHLDVFLPAYTDYSSQAQNYLLKNRGDGTFVEIADAAGVALRNWPHSIRVEGAQALDINGDGFLDLYTGSHLYINNGNMTFTDARQAYGLPIFFDEGIKFFDWNNDGYIDLLMHHPENGPTLFQFNGHTFAPVANAFDSRYYNRTYGLNAEDVDGDGFMDVVIAGGINPDGTAKSATLFLNRNGRYVISDILSAPTGFGDIWGFADFDNNGTMDMILRSHGTMRYLKNSAADPSSIKVFMFSESGAQNQQGRMIRATPASDPEFIMTRFVDGGSGYLTNNEYAVTFPTPKGGQYWITAHFNNRVVGGWVNPGSIVKIYRDGRFIVNPR